MSTFVESDCTYNDPIFSRRGYGAGTGWGLQTGQSTLFIFGLFINVWKSSPIIGQPCLKLRWHSHHFHALPLLLLCPTRLNFCFQTSGYEIEMLDSVIIEHISCCVPFCITLALSFF